MPETFVCRNVRYRFERFLVPPDARDPASPQIMEVTAEGGARCVLKSFTLAGEADPDRVAREVAAALHRFDPPNLSPALRDCLAPILGVDVDNGRLVVVRPFYEGLTLDELCRSLARGADQPLPAAVWQHLERLAGLLDELSARHLAHGHVCPANVLLPAAPGGLRLLDAGVALAVGRRDRGEKARLLADPSYLPPGALDADAAPRHIDQHGIACLYCKLRTNHLPSKEELAARSHPILGDQELAVLRAALDPDVNKRWPNCYEFVRRLKNSLGAASTVAPRASKLHAPLPDAIVLLRRYAEAVLNALPTATQLPPAGYERAVEEVRALANQTAAAAHSPVRIGVVGDFSGGKSLLLSAFIGNADALPIEARPSTGNITALLLRSEPGLSRTEVGTPVVHWMDQQTALRCLENLLKAADAAASALPEVDRTPLAGFLDKVTAQGAGDWDGIEQWCRESWDRCGAPPNPDFRGILRELLLFCRCCASPVGAALLQHGPRTTPLASLKTAKDGLLLPPVDRLSELAFTDLAPRPAFADLPHPLTPEFLRALFPLIRRVDMEIRLPAALWDVTARPESPGFMLLDFPGLGAAQSGVRDSFLCMQELQEVQTILIVLNATRAGSRAGLNLFNQLQQTRPGQDLRHNILVAVNRFDEFPNGAPAPDAVIDERRLKEALPDLHTVVAECSGLTTHEDRVVFTSALVALDRLANDWPVSQEALENARYLLSRWYTDDEQRWRRVADKMSQADPHSVLAPRLRALAADGGVARLKDLVLAHVAEHGLAQLHDRVLQLARDVRKRYEGLPRYDPSKGTSRLPPERLRDQVRALRQEYWNLLSEMRRTPPVLQVEAGGQEVTLDAAVAEDVREEIWGWDVWNDLLNQMQDGQLIAQSPDDIFGTTRPPPEDTLHFLEHTTATTDENPQDGKVQGYGPSLAACWQRTEQAAEQALVRLFGKTLAERVRPLAAGLSNVLLDPQISARLASRRAGNTAEMLKWVRWAADPAAPSLRDFLVEQLKRQPVVADARPAPGRDPLRSLVEQSYPLPGTKGDTKEQRLPWSTVLQDREMKDQVLLARLRNQLVVAARDRLRRRVQQFNQFTAAALESFCRQAERRLVEALDHPAFLEAVAGDPLPGESTWLATPVSWPFPKDGV